MRTQEIIRNVVPLRAARAELTDTEASMENGYARRNSWLCGCGDESGATGTAIATRLTGLPRLRVLVDDVNLRSRGLP